jgi:DNA replication protein DnaC
VPRLVQELALARGDGSYSRFLGRLAKVELLVLDDWGLTTFTEAAGRDFLEVVEDRYQLRSTIIASQLPLENWHALLPDPTVADAILDRLVHNAHKITLKGESMRKVINADLNQSVHCDI